MHPLEIRNIPNRADRRGDSYYLPQEAMKFVGRIRELHFASILPGQVRGNHYHVGKRESILISFKDKWRLSWRPLHGSDIITRDFDGSGAVLVQVEPEVVHAIKNSGAVPITILSFSNKQFDLQNPDAFRLVLIE